MTTTADRLKAAHEDAYRQPDMFVKPPAPKPEPEQEAMDL